MGWIANVFVFVSVWRLAHRDRWAFLYGVVGSGLWALKAVMVCQWDLLAVNLLLGCLHLRGWYMWRERL